MTDLNVNLIIYVAICMLALPNAKDPLFALFSLFYRCVKINPKTTFKCTNFEFTHSEG